MGAFSKILGVKADYERQQNFDDSNTVCLTIDERHSSRLLTKTKAGNSCVIVLARGGTIRGGTVLGDKDNNLLLVEAALEEVSTIRSPNKLALMCIAYHLGNRHVPLEITNDYLRYQVDHVLDEMVVRLGGQVTNELSSFEPITGAYSHHH